MTAEVVIMNREAVALAADSAVSLTVGPSERPEKIFTTASKIFPLSPRQPVAVMVFNNATFMGIPWETVVTLYRGRLGGKTFGTIREYTEDFTGFLRTEGSLVPPEEEDRYFVSFAYRTFIFVRYMIQEQATAVLREKGQVSEDEIQQITAAVVSGLMERLKAAGFGQGMDEAYTTALSERYREPVGKAVLEVFERLPVSEETAGVLRDLVVLYFVKAMEQGDPMTADFSGVVFAGFGDSEIFPSMWGLTVWGRVQQRLKYLEGEQHAITFQNGGIIIPLAQREMVDIFLSGMDPRFEAALVGSLAQTFQNLPDAVLEAAGDIGETGKKGVGEALARAGQEIVQQLQVQLERYRLFNVNPILNVVTTLPPADLSSLAESLVNLTSLKRRVSLEAETVGGPVDVAIISKGDGFVWVKRKDPFGKLPSPGSGAGVRGEGRG